LYWNLFRTWHASYYVLVSNKSLVLDYNCYVSWELAATGASPNVQNNASFSGVVLSVGQQKALFSGVIPTVGTNLGIGLFSGQIPIMPNLNTRKITNVTRPWI